MINVCASIRSYDRDGNPVGEYIGMIVDKVKVRNNTSINDMYVVIDSRNRFQIVSPFDLLQYKSEEEYDKELDKNTNKFSL